MPIDDDKNIVIETKVWYRVEIKMTGPDLLLYFNEINGP